MQSIPDLLSSFSHVPDQQPQPEPHRARMPVAFVIFACFGFSLAIFGFLLGGQSVRFGFLSIGIILVILVSLSFYFITHYKLTQLPLRRIQSISMATTVNPSSASVTEHSHELVGLCSPNTSEMADTMHNNNNNILNTHTHRSISRQSSNNARANLLQTYLISGLGYPAVIGGSMAYTSAHSAMHSPSVCNTSIDDPPSYETVMQQDSRYHIRRENREQTLQDSLSNAYDEQQQQEEDPPSYESIMVHAQP